MPLQKKPLIFLILFIFLTSSLSGCILDSLFGTSLTLNSWNVSDYEDFAAIEINFSISEKLVLKTFDPNSNLIDTDFFYNSGETILNLAEHKKTPSPGQYLLKVYNKDNSEVSQETFTFDGPNLNILSCDQKWWQNQGNFYLIGLSTIVQNTGDMPVYPAYITIEFDDESITGSILPSSIMPGYSKELQSYVFYNNTPQSSTFTCAIKDVDYNILATETFDFDVESNVASRSFTEGIAGKLTIPYPDFLFDYYSGLERLTVDDYGAFVLDKYDDEYLDFVIYLLKNSMVFGEEWFNSKSDLTKVEYIAGFVQAFEYKQDSIGDDSFEYPRYPVETLFNGAGAGDCEDTAILTASLLKNLGFEVALFRLPEHMAVGVKLDEKISGKDYYTEDYYFLETTQEVPCGQYHSDYKNPEELEVYCLEDRPFLIHEWKNGNITIFYDTWEGDIVKVNIFVENLGTQVADNILVEGVFYSDKGTEFNSESTVIPSIKPGEKKKILLEIGIPGITSLWFETRIYDDSEIVHYIKSLGKL